MPQNKLIILPSENQTREFDAKFLLACVLAEHGNEVVVGARHLIHNRIASFRPGIYVAKDFRKPSERILSLIAGLGHHIVAWDEEGLVQPQAQLYYQRRFSTKAISNVQSVFAWGPANMRLMEAAPGWPNLPIHPTGNPRLDMLRTELRGFHSAEAERLKMRYENFVLFDSNFASFNPAISNSAPVLFDKGGSLSPYLQGRKRLFERWQNLIPLLAEAIAPLKIIVRPHPAESHKIWKDIAAKHENVGVVHEGSALAWILASRVMLHSGCTTGLEAALMGQSTIAFRPEDLTKLADDLPDSLSIVARGELELIALVQKYLRNEKTFSLSNAQQEIAEDAAFALSGPLASERIADVLNTLEPRGTRQFKSLIKSRARQIEKWFTGLNPSHKTSAAKNALRYPGVSPEQAHQKLEVLQSTMHLYQQVKVSTLYDDIFVLKT